MADQGGNAEGTLGAGAKLGKYHIRSVIGRGAMGTVLEAWDPVIDRRVAIKTVKLPGAQDAEMEEELQRFRREAQAAGRLTHPNIVGVFDYGETDELAYIVMEFVDGPSVKGKLDTNERFAPVAIARLMEDLLSGLDYSHRAGVIHRDIKPANIMLTKNGQAKIADFGIARIESSSMTQAGTLLGTPAYMSPEQFRGETVDLRTDIYSSGVLLYQLLTGDRPFEGSLSSIMHKALTTEPPAPSALSGTAPRLLDAVVARAMAKRPQDRFATASDFMAAIHAAMSNQPALAESDATVFRPPPPAVRPAVAEKAAPRSTMLPLLLGGGAVLVVAAAGAAFVFRGSPAPPSKPVQVALAPADPAPVTAVPASPAAPAASPPTPATAASARPVQSVPDSAAPATASPFVIPPEPAPVQPAAPAAGGQPKIEPAPPLPAASIPVIPVSPAPAGPTPAAEPSAPTRLASNVPTPSPSPALVRQRIIAGLAALPCTAVTGDLTPSGSAQLVGLTAPNGLGALQQALAAAGAALRDDNSVVQADPTYCPTLSAIASIMPPFGATGPHLTLAEASGGGRLADGDYIRPRIQMPPFGGTLLVDYYAHDGTVEHIYPRIADKEQKMPADPSRPFTAGELVALGDPGARHATFQVGEPYGRDMIVAIAASQPLFPVGRSRNGEQSTVYAHDLQAALDQARTKGARLAASVLSLETVTK